MWSVDKERIGPWDDLYAVVSDVPGSITVFWADKDDAWMLRDILNEHQVKPIVLHSEVK